MTYDIFGNPIPPQENRHNKKPPTSPKSHYRAKIDSFYHPEILDGIPKTRVFNMPLIRPNTIIPKTNTTTPFDRIGNKSAISDSLVVFFLNDQRFYSALSHPWDYTKQLLCYTGVIGPDLSQYIDMDYVIRLYHNYWNKVFTAYWQIRGINMYPNVTWSLPDSYEYCIAGLPRNSVIAINSMGVPKYHFSKGLWLKGYRYVVKHLDPILILRYGPKIEGEYESLSLYLENVQLNILKNGRKRKQNER